MEKDSFIKARLSAATKRDFEAICQTLGVLPTTKTRELLEAFVQREYGRLEDRVTVHIHHPSDYSLGAWRVKMRLRDPGAMSWQDSPVPFAFPNLPKRRLHPDEGYLAVVQRAGSGELGIGGQFLDGIWEGHLYSNGIDEESNPTSIEDVRAALHDTIAAIIDRIAVASRKPQ